MLTLNPKSIKINSVSAAAIESKKLRKATGKMLRQAFAFALLQRAIPPGFTGLLISVDGRRFHPTLTTTPVPIRRLRSRLSPNLRWLAKGPIHVLGFRSVKLSDLPAWASLRTHTLAICLRQPRETILMTLPDYERALAIEGSVAAPVYMFFDFFAPALTHGPVPSYPVDIAPKNLLQC